VFNESRIIDIQENQNCDLKKLVCILNNDILISFNKRRIILDNRRVGLNLFVNSLIYLRNIKKPKFKNMKKSKLITSKPLINTRMRSIKKLKEWHRITRMMNLFKNFWLS